MTEEKKADEVAEKPDEAKVELTDLDAEDVRGGAYVTPDCKVLLRSATQGDKPEYFRKRL